ncbi:gas vesicle protein GvpG [bacterium]|nr:gas vesicle protein GvpG [Planctomycetota bacterium]MBU1517965.1 gas vesicle protein GvpG [Planctomycetota bacterium]MBU2461770.1 gas vesicle protein GvpG [bacterium]
MFLIDSILLAPLKGVVWLGEKLNEVADKELNDDGLIKQELMELQLRFELDEISEQEYNEKEKELLDRLDAITKSKER